MDDTITTTGSGSSSTPPPIVPAPAPPPAAVTWSGLKASKESLHPESDREIHDYFASFIFGLDRGKYREVSQILEYISRIQPISAALVKVDNVGLQLTHSTEHFGQHLLIYAQSVVKAIGEKPLPEERLALIRLGIFIYQTALSSDIDAEALQAIRSKLLEMEVVFKTLVVPQVRDYTTDLSLMVRLFLLDNPHGFEEMEVVHQLEQKLPDFQIVLASMLRERVLLSEKEPSIQLNCMLFYIRLVPFDPPSCKDLMECIVKMPPEFLGPISCEIRQKLESLPPVNGLDAALLFRGIPQLVPQVDIYIRQLFLEYPLIQNQRVSEIGTRLMQTFVHLNPFCDFLLKFLEGIPPRRRKQVGMQWIETVIGKKGYNPILHHYSYETPIKLNQLREMMGITDPSWFETLLRKKISSQLPGGILTKVYFNPGRNLSLESETGKSSIPNEEELLTIYRKISQLLARTDEKNPEVLNLMQIYSNTLQVMIYLGLVDLDQAIKDVDQLVRFIAKVKPKYPQFDFGSLLDKSKIGSVGGDFSSQFIAMGYITLQMYLLQSQLDASYFDYLFAIYCTKYNDKPFLKQLIGRVQALLEPDHPNYQRLQLLKDGVDSIYNIDGLYTVYMKIFLLDPVIKIRNREGFNDQTEKDFGRSIVAIWVGNQLIEYRGAEGGLKRTAGSESQIGAKSEMYKRMLANLQTICPQFWDSIEMFANQATHSVLIYLMQSHYHFQPQNHPTLQIVYYFLPIDNSTVTFGTVGFYRDVFDIEGQIYPGICEATFKVEDGQLRLDESRSKVKLLEPFEDTDSEAVANQRVIDQIQGQGFGYELVARNRASYQT